MTLERELWWKCFYHLTNIWLDVIFLSAQVAITATNVSQLQLFEDGQPACAVLALHPSDDQTQGLGSARCSVRCSSLRHRLTLSALMLPSSGQPIPAREVVAFG